MTLLNLNGERLPQYLQKEKKKRKPTAIPRADQSSGVSFSRTQEFWGGGGVDSSMCVCTIKPV